MKKNLSNRRKALITKLLNSIRMIRKFCLFDFLPVALLIFSITLNPPGVKAQTGSVGGVVIDAVTGEFLEDVRLMIPETGQTTRTDEEGRYVLRGVPAGSHTLEARLLGYAMGELSISVSSGVYAEHTIRLSDTFLDGDRIFVSARQRGEFRALNRQRESSNFSTVISAEQIDQFEHFTAGDVLARLPGVQLDRFGEINMRGTSALAQGQYHVNFNGLRMASTGLGHRGTDPGIISADMVRDLEFRRVITPDMDADAIHGAVHIRTARPPAEGRKLGIIVGGKAHPDYFKYTGPGSRTAIHYSEALTDNLGLAVDLSHQMNSDAWESLDIDYGVDNFSGGPIDVIERVSPGLNSMEQSRIGAGIKLRYTPGENVVHYVRGMYHHDEQSGETHRQFWQANQDWYGPDSTGFEGEKGTHGYNLDLLDRDTRYFMLQAGSKHRFDRFDLEYSAGWSQSQVEQTASLFPFMAEDLDFYINAEDRTRPSMTINNRPLRRDGTLDTRLIHYQGLERVLDEHTDQRYSARVDMDFSIGTGDFRFGSSALRNSKNGNFSDAFYDYAARLNLFRFRHIRDGDIHVFDEDAYHIPWVLNSERATLFFDDNKPLFTRDEDLERKNSEIWNYDALEHIWAGYGMATFEWGRFAVLGGARIEHTNSNNEGYRITFDEDGDFEHSHSVSRENNYTHLFPHLQLSFSPAGQARIRGAYSRTIARPAYNRLSPFRFEHRQDSTLFLGNPQLDPMLSDNLDLMADYYFYNSGHFGLNLFYKELSSPVVERRRVIDEGEFAGWQERTFENSDESIPVYGVEVSWQQNLTFLPGFLRHLGTYSNYTWTHSVYNLVDRDEEMRIPGQSPHVVNAALYYSQGRFFVQTAWHWTSEALIWIAETPSLAPAAGPGSIYMDQYEDGASDLSVNVKFRIAEQFRFWADASNLLRHERYRYADSRVTYPFETDLRKGIHFRMGIRYDL